jgi:long-chain acyl-CoA synthetase
VTAFNTIKSRKLGTVGKPLHGVSVRLGPPDDTGKGEIFIQGPNVFSGYFNNPEATREALNDGWFRTNDLGTIDRKGFLTVHGRRNDIIVLSSGKKINPENVESFLLKSPFIKEACLFTSDSPLEKDALIAAIYPHLEHFREHGFSQIKDKIRFEVERLSVQLPAYERLKRYFITNEPLPKTLLGKIKRYEVKKIFAYVPEEKDPVRTQEQVLTPEETKLLESPLSQEVMRYLAEVAKRPVNLHDNLELDLGLDSLERVGLFFELQKRIGQELDERTFLGVSTVREIIMKLHTATGARIPEKEAISWEQILNSPLEKETRDEVSISQNALEKLINYIGGIFLKVLFGVYFRLSVKGREHLPKEGPFILCPNHTSYLDAFLIGAALDLPRALQTFFLGYTAYINAPGIRRIKNLFRMIAIDPMQKLDASLKLCGFVLRNGKILLMFPEGDRSPDGAVKKFKKGTGILIKEMDVPVVPVYIDGAFSAWSAHGKFPRPHRIRVTFGPVLTPEMLRSKDKGDLDIYQDIVDNLRMKVLSLAPGRKD